MASNPVLDELYAARERLLAEAGGDVHAYLEGVRDRERASGRLLSADEQRAIRCGGAEKTSSSRIESLSSSD